MWTWENNLLLCTFIISLTVDSSVTSARVSLYFCGAIWKSYKILYLVVFEMNYRLWILIGWTFILSTLCWHFLPSKLILWKKIIIIVVIILVTKYSKKKYKQLFWNCYFIKYILFHFNAALLNFNDIYGSKKFSNYSI